MRLHDQPICYSCLELIEDGEPVYAARCGHAGCPSVCWHGLCLMEFRDTERVRASIVRQRD